MTITLVGPHDSGLWSAGRAPAYRRLRLQPAPTRERRRFLRSPQDPGLRACIPVHRNGFGPARRDIGAFEFQPQALGLGGDPQPGPGAPAPVPPVQPPGAPTPPAQAPGPGAPAPVPSPKPDAKDTRAPGLSRLAVRSAGRTVRTLRSTKRATARLRLTLGERALVAVEVQRRVGKRWVRTATLKRTLAAGAPSMSMGTALRRAAAGSYRLRVHATDAAGNRSALRSLAFTVARR